MNKLYNTYLFVILSIVNGYGQNCYEDFYKEGIKAFNNYDFEIALNQFKAAKICDDKPKDNDLETWIRKTQDGYLNAIIKAKEDAEQQLNRANRLIESIYFFDGKYALMYGPKKIDNIYIEYDSDGILKNKLYYFINMQGDEVKKLGRWDFIENFDNYGFTKGRPILIDTIETIDNRTNQIVLKIIKTTTESHVFALLDTTGQRYRLPYRNDDDELDYINAYYNNYRDSIPRKYLLKGKLKLLVARNKNLAVIPPEIGNLVNLKHLDLRDNRIQFLPASIRKLKKLHYLNLSNNQLKSIPNYLDELTNLEIIIFEGNQIPVSEINRLKISLPNCIIVN